MVHLIHEEIVKLHLRNLQQEIEGCRVGQQVLARKRELSKLSRQAKSTTKEKQSIIGRLINIGNRMF